VPVSETVLSSDELDACVAAVRAAMVVCRSVAASSVDRLTKADESPVTVADFASQAVVLHLLRQRLGPLEVVGEESAEALRGSDAAAIRQAVTRAARLVWSGATEDAVLAAIDAGHQREPGASYWTLDPIDGTKGFLRGGQYAVSLAKVVEGEVALGLLGCPALGFDLSRPLDVPDPIGSVFVGQGDTTRCASGEGGDWAPVSCSPDVRPDPIVVTHSVESGHTRAGDIARIFEHLGWSWHSLPADSQAKYAMVARGQAHVYMRIPGDPRRMEPVWDHAAGVAVARGAGAIVTDLAGRTLDFSQGVGLRANHGIICAHPAVHGALVRATSELGLGR
jgi:3'(2'), 5'-bisphosphate nucleotidase